MPRFDEAIVCYFVSLHPVFAAAIEYIFLLFVLLNLFRVGRLPLFYRFFKRPIHNDVAELVLKRCKSMLGYTESRPEYVEPTSLLHRYVKLQQ